VRHAHRRTLPGGGIEEAPMSLLQSIAQTSLSTAIGELYAVPSLLQRMYEDKKTLTVASGTTEYEIGQYDILKVREILSGSDERPIRPFFEDSGDFYEWKERRYAGSTLSDSTDPYVAYMRRNGNKLYLNFWPGVGSETSVILVHDKMPASPFLIEAFPSHLHGAILVGAVRWANGGRQGYSEQWEQAKADIVKGFDPARGTTSKLRKSDTLRRFLRRQNSCVSGSSLSSQSTPKGL